MMLGRGARPVHLIEYCPIVVTEAHVEALKPLMG